MNILSTIKKKRTAIFIATQIKKTHYDITITTAKGQQDGSRAIAPEENCPPTIILTLTLNQTLTLTGGQFPRG